MAELEARQLRDACRLAGRDKPLRHDGLELDRVGSGLLGAAYHLFGTGIAALMIVAHLSNHEHRLVEIMWTDFHETSDLVMVKHVVRLHNAKAETLVKAQRACIGDLRADAQSRCSADCASGGDEGTGNAPAAKRRGNPNEVDRQNAVSGADQLREASERAIGLTEDHVVAARAGEEIAGPVGAAAVGDRARDDWVEMQPGLAEAVQGEGHDRIAVTRAGASRCTRGRPIAGNGTLKDHGGVDHMKAKLFELPDGVDGRGRQASVKKNRVLTRRPDSFGNCIVATVRRQCDPKGRSADNPGQEVIADEGRQITLRSNVSLRAKRFLYHSI